MVKLKACGQVGVENKHPTVVRTIEMTITIKNSDHC